MVFFSSLLYRACFVMIAGTFLCGCSHHIIDKHYKGPLPLPATIINEYMYEKADMQSSTTIMEDRCGYTVKRIEFESSKNVVPFSHQIKLDYYDINGTDATPVILVLPILGGSNTIAEIIAGYLAENGYSAIIVHRNNDYKKFDDLEMLDLLFRQMVFDHMQVLDWVNCQSDIDSEKIGLFGVSMGGIKGFLVTALDQRIKSAVIALAGGDLPYIFSFSQEHEIVRKRRRIMETQHLTLDALHQILKQSIQCDPINYAPYVDARKILMVLAKYDNTVPIKMGEALRIKMGRPETIYLYSGHYSAIPFIFYINYKALQFFKRSFKDYASP